MDRSRLERRKLMEREHAEQPSKATESQANRTSKLAKTAEKRATESHHNVKDPDEW